MNVRLDDSRHEIEIQLEPARFARRDATVVFAWVVLIAGVSVGGRIINESFATNLLAPPLFGRFDIRLGPATLIAAAVGVIVVWWGPRVAAILPWRLLLVVTTTVAAVWAVSLALLDGVDALSAPLTGPHDYLASVGRVDSPGVSPRIVCRSTGDLLATRARTSSWDGSDSLGFGAGRSGRGQLGNRSRDRLGSLGVGRALAGGEVHGGRIHGAQPGPFPRAVARRDLDRHLGRRVLHGSRRVGNGTARSRRAVQVGLPGAGGWRCTRSSPLSLLRGGRTRPGGARRRLGAQAAFARCWSRWLECS